jgi:GT2 family glycosyltransferase
MQRVGIVVPTLGKRPDYLSQCLESINRATTGDNKPFVVMVAPSGFDASSFLSAGLVHKFVDDPGTGLAEAINLGFSSMPESVEFINWLGDDDLVAPESIDIASSFLDSHNETVLVFGGCDYIDPNGKVVWTNKSGQFTVPLLRFGPDLIPQPGALFRRSAFDKVGGLDTSFAWAFDFELLIKLSKVGKLSYLNKVLSSFRWHPESLSVEYRKKSVAEASRARVSHLPALLKPISFMWEVPVRYATLSAGNRVTSKARKIATKR